jgi:hypothetical protein
MIYLDTETCGLHSFVVLLQYAEDDGDIKMWEFWRHPISESIDLLEWLAQQDVCGFNLAFDWYHLYKAYTTFVLADDYNIIPEDNIEYIAELEYKARGSNVCLKPKRACDVMLWARKGPYQSLMERSDIRVKRVPTCLATLLRNELEDRIELDGIYFSRRKDKYAPQWQIRDLELPNGDVDPDFKDIVLKFSASGSLKNLAQHALGVKEDLILKLVDIGVNEHWNPVELGYAPFANAVGNKSNWKGAWPEVIHHHINHWAYSDLARKYAANDIVYTRDLYKFFESPEPGDTDSELACMIGAVRWRGYKLDVEGLKKQRDLAIAKRGSVKTAPNAVKGYLREVMSAAEAMVTIDKEGTGEKVLKSISEWKGNTVAAKRAQEVLDARGADKEIELFDKLIKSERFHASFKAIGALSGRMSGADGLNPQGIKGVKEIRECFPLADNGHILCGGDFDSFEVAISEAVYKDPKLREDLLTEIDCPKCEGKGCKDCKDGKTRLKIHGLFAQELFPGFSYEDILKSEKTENDMYKAGKSGIFAMNYGGNAQTLENRLHIDAETANKAYESFAKRYPGIAKARQRIFDMFCSMRQPGGIGSAVIWAEPSDYIESLLGFPRYFTLENRICKELFNLAQNPPKGWKFIKLKVKRRDRMQTVAGAAQSALFASAFNIQASNMRAAANHEIQSTGAGITKELQRRVWDVQPYGVHKWLVQPMNIHDEVLTPVDPSKVDEVKEIVHTVVESYRPIVPLIGMDWKTYRASWGDK